MIEARNLSLTMGSRTLLNNLSLTLKSGEVLAVLGANGAGKSSLLKVLGGQWPASSGTIRMNGTDLSEYSKAQRARFRAIMPQSTLLAFPFRVWEVVALGRTPFGYRSRVREHDQALDMLTLTETEHLAERRFTQLSGGEMQRVQLARVLNQLLSSPAPQRVLFLDECTASLDPAHQHQVFQLVRALTGLNIAVFAIVHDINLAAQYADRVLFLKDGQLQSLGLTAKEMTPTQIQRTFSLNTLDLRHPDVSGARLVASETPVQLNPRTQSILRQMQIRPAQTGAIVSAMIKAS
ncbi:MAG: heme ABC transporter ATP-binding protein [Saccharospirillum sp.]